MRRGMRTGLSAHLWRLWITAGALAGAVAVAMGAVAAHAVAVTPDRAAMLQSALRMQEIASLALIACGLLARERESRRGTWLTHAAAAAFLAGLLLFCGALYALAMGGIHIGPVAPTGGVLLILGWLLLAASAW